MQKKMASVILATLFQRIEDFSPLKQTILCLNYRPNLTLGKAILQYFEVNCLKYFKI